ncbi:hypothetical protein A2483_03740 [Candidatus Peregrinibacteria bacterium RIFOXYC2_FULL_33_13]|nr:MAG: hypothetical protein UR30_C0008G0092 [Candidatus Peregrinibacteria bacterium GW2011_GWC2_33_13]OGJ54173.1 MAG: hypothetical protein A2483_03740 [Candidatus Peregrinibacteria bacterium RIFOXYC2_FULL_33_13]
MKKILVSCLLVVALTATTANASNPWGIKIPVKNTKSGKVPTSTNKMVEKAFSQVPAMIYGYVYDSSSNDTLTLKQVKDAGIKITADYSNSKGKGTVSAKFDDFGKYSVTVPGTMNSQKVTLKLTSSTYKSKTVKVPVTLTEFRILIVEREYNIPTDSLMPTLPLPKPEDLLPPPFKKDKEDEQVAELTGYIYDMDDKKVLTKEELEDKDMILTLVTNQLQNAGQVTYNAEIDSKDNYTFKLPIEFIGQQATLNFSADGIEPYDAILTITASKHLVINVKHKQYPAARIYGHIYDSATNKLLTKDQIKSAQVEIYAKFEDSKGSATLKAIISETEDGYYYVNIPGTGSNQKVDLYVYSSYYQDQVIKDVEVVEEAYKLVFMER